MTRTSNPYTNGNVIHKDEDFYDRDDLTGIVHRREPRAYYLKGNRRIGKTSLLRQIERNLIADSEFSPRLFQPRGCSERIENRNRTRNRDQHTKFAEPYPYLNQHLSLVYSFLK
jgi:hypothetical protein